MAYIYLILIMCVSVLFMKRIHLIFFIERIILKDHRIELLAKFYLKNSIHFSRSLNMIQM